MRVGEVICNPSAKKKEKKKRKMVYEVATSNHRKLNFKFLNLKLK